MHNPAYPALREFMNMMGEAGSYLAQIDSCEGAAGLAIINPP